MSYDLRFAVKADFENECRFVNIGYPEYYKYYAENKDKIKQNMKEKYDTKKKYD